MNKNNKSLISESKSILSREFLSEYHNDVNWLLSDYKTNPLHDKVHPFFDLRDPLKYPYIILAVASEDGATIPLMSASKEDAEAYKNQKGKEGVKFTGPFKLTMA